MSESENSLVNVGQGGSVELGARAATAPFQLSQEPHTAPGQTPAAAPDSHPAPAYEHLGELPATYGTQSLYLVAYDPRQLFAYWDIDWAAAAGSSYALQVLRADGSTETRIELKPSEVSRYIPVREPGGRYAVELTARGRDGQWRPLATSGPVTMPPEGVAHESEPAFATLPFHLSFQRLIDLLHHAMRPHEAITDVLARLQQGGHLAASNLLGALGSLGEDQLRTLQLLVHEGFDPAAELASSSGEFPGSGSGGLSSPGGRNSFGRLAGATETLSSSAFSSSATAVGAGGSELLSSGVLSAAGSSENLSSGGLSSELRLAAAAAGAESFSSSAFGSEARWLGAGMSSETLSSRMRGPLFSASGMGSETLSSGDISRRALYSSAGGMSSETLSSGAGAGGLSSQAFAAAAARGSEILGSASRPGFGLSSEAWRMAGGQAVGSSENLSSNQASLFLRAMEANLDVLGSLFSSVNSQLSGEAGDSSSLSSSSRGRW